MGQNIGEYPVDQFPGEISVDIRFTHEVDRLSSFLDELDDLAKLHGVTMSYPVMEAMVVPDLDNGAGS